MGFSKKVTEDALVLSGRCCCLCHKFCGTKMELHHIKQKKDGGEDTLNNCLPLCFDCHADVMQYNPNHPKGKRYTLAELMRHRDEWYKKIESSQGVDLSANNYTDIDKETYSKLITLLEPKGIMFFIKRNGFVLGSFSDSIFRKLAIYLTECELPNFEFIDSDLESLKSNLTDRLVKLDTLITKNTFPAGPDSQSIPREWEEEQPERFERAINEFEEITAEAYSSYENLIKLARRKLFKN